MWPPRRPRMELDKVHYEQDENAEPELPRRRNRARRRVNLFIVAEAGVNGDASGDEEINDENNDLDKFIVADNIEF